MEEIHLVDQGVYNHLMEIPTKYWKAREKPIVSMLEDIRNYVNKCYKKETYIDCYQHVIYPVNGPNLWERTQNDDVLPPGLGNQ
ncbi:hypothetical protein AHAS_Ahas01G0102600 [Arachis hypogaea]